MSIEFRNLETMYYGDVNPLIENGEYELATVALNSAWYATIRGNEPRLLTKRRGQSVVSSLQALRKMLRRGDETRIAPLAVYFKRQLAQAGVSGDSPEGIGHSESR